MKGLICRQVESGVEFEVRVKPGASSSKVLGTYGHRLKLAVAAPPEDGKANRALRRLLAELLNVHLMDVEIKRGAASRDKTIAVRGVSAPAVQELLLDCNS